jgi:hypothetical protein
MIAVSRCLLPLLALVEARSSLGAKLSGKARPSAQEMQREF